MYERPLADKAMPLRCLNIDCMETDNGKPEPARRVVAYLIDAYKRRYMTLDLWADNPIVKTLIDCWKKDSFFYVDGEFQYDYTFEIETNTVWRIKSIRLLTKEETERHKVEKAYIEYHRL